MRGNCKNCQWWIVDGLNPGTTIEHAVEGECRFNPPTASVVDCRGLWPITLYSEGCGEYKESRDFLRQLRDKEQLAAKTEGRTWHP